LRWKFVFVVDPLPLHRDWAPHYILWDEVVFVPNCNWHRHRDRDGDRAIVSHGDDDLPLA